MSKVIEVLDSDDELEASAALIVKRPGGKAKILEELPTTMSGSDSGSDEEIGLLEEAAMLEKLEPSNKIAALNPATLNAAFRVAAASIQLPRSPVRAVSTPSTDAESPPKDRIKNRRKSVHHVMRSSSEIQFEVGLKDESAAVNIGNEHDTQFVYKAGGLRKMPNILCSKPKTNHPVYLEEEVEGKAVFSEFFKNPDIKQMIRSIIMDRVRINYLLKLCELPDISFPLYSEDRLLQLINDRFAHWHANIITKHER